MYIKQGLWYYLIQSYLQTTRQSWDWTSCCNIAQHEWTWYLIKMKSQHLKSLINHLNWN